MSLGTRSHMFRPENEMDSVPFLMEFTHRLCNGPCGENYMGLRRAQIYHLKWVKINYETS